MFRTLDVSYFSIIMQQTGVRNVQITGTKHPRYGYSLSSHGQFSSDLTWQNGCISVSIKATMVILVSICSELNRLSDEIEVIYARAKYLE